MAARTTCDRYWAVERGWADRVHFDRPPQLSGFGVSLRPNSSLLKMDKTSLPLLKWSDTKEATVLPA